MYERISAVVFICCAISNVVSQDVTVSYMTPSYAGRYGGTRISIFGTDFDTNLQLDSSEPTKEVKFVSPFNEYDCLLHDAESDESQIVCYTSVMDIGTYYVRVKMNGIWLDNSKYCGGNNVHWRCRLLVREWRTPLLYSLSWVTNEPQQLINVVGRIYTNIISSAEAEATNGITSAITRAWLTAGACLFYNETNEPYGIYLYGVDGTSHWGEFTCLVESSYVGNQNVSFIVGDDYGRSFPYTTIRRVSADNRIYMVQTYAVVTDVSPKMGSIIGGTLLTISGRYFDDLSGIKAKVYVGGEECVVQEVTDTTITCIAPPQATTRTMYSGGRGIRVEVFPGANNITATLDSSEPGVWTAFSDHTYPNFFTQNNFISRSQGFFVPSVDANYYMSIRADDHFDFYFNAQGNNPADAILVASSRTANQDVATDRFALVAGVEYYYEIRHLEYGSNEHFKIAVHVDKTNYTPDETSSAVTEVQDLTISSTIAKEVQTVKFQDWVQQTSVESVWNATIVCINATAGCGGYSFAFTLFGTSTVSLTYGSSSAALVQIAFNNLVSLGGDTVAVVETETGYTITFQSTRGRVFLSASSMDDTILTVLLTEITVGEPQLDTFTFKLNEFVSPPVQIDGSESDVANAVMSLFGPSCPYNIEAGIGNRKAYYDMESDVIPSGTRSSEASFCGIYSLKNPNYLYNNDVNSYKTSIYNDVCFAYIGDISDILEITYSYTETVDSVASDYSHSLRNLWTVGLSDSPDAWTHYCYDVNTRLKEEHPNGLGFEVNAIYIRGGSDSETDLFVDNIFIGKSSLSSVERDAAVNLVIPPAVLHIKLESVDVVKSVDEFKITFNPIDCGHNFPLLGFAFANDQSPTSADHTAYSFGNNAQQIHVHRNSSASPPVSGTFDLSFTDGGYQILTNMSPDMTESAFKNELETLLQINTVSVVRSGTCYGYTWRVNFASPGGDYPLMVPDGTNLVSSPDVANISSAEISGGGLFMDPVYGDFLRIAHNVPQVQVYINGVPSHCQAEFDSYSNTSCDFQWMMSSTPQVTDVTPSSGPAGTSIVITGSGFSDTMSDNAVTIGDVGCVVSSSTNSTITCTVGNSPAGNQLISVNIAGTGLANISGSFTHFPVTGEVTSITPSSGSIHGCTSVTIAGSGFDSSSIVTIGGSSCAVSSFTYSSITCKTSPGSAATVTVDVATSGVTVSSSVNYEYTVSGVGSVTSISASTLSVAGGETFTISGTGFGSSQGKVYFGSVEITNVTSWTDTDIMIIQPSRPPGTYDVIVEIVSIGCAASSESVVYTFTVTNVSPTSGSLVGGTMVTMTGSGFTESMTVVFGDVSCVDVVVTNAGSTMTCVTNSASTAYQVTNSGSHPTYGIGYGWKPSTLDVTAGDQVTIAWSVPVLVTDVNIGLFTTTDSSSIVYDDDGFQIPAATSGQHTFKANNPGIIHYASGCVDSNCDVFMRGVINVAEAATSVKSLSANINGQEAEYSPSGYSFTFSKSLTPTVTSISPRQGTTDTVITIEGSGFDASPTVKIGGKTCDVQSSSTSAISCRMLVAEQLSVEIYHDVTVYIDGIGNARIDINNAINQTFVLLPLITSFSPVVGSLSGGTKLTIQGSGFTNQSTVLIGGWVSCDIVADETDYDVIVCETSSVTSPTSGTVQVTQGQSVAEYNSANFQFSTSATPVVTSWNHTNVFSNLDINLYGSGFGTSGVTVRLTSASSTSCDVTSVNDMHVVCNVMGFSVGENDITMHVSGKGLANFDGVSSAITNPPAIYSISPNTGSINGGTTVTIAGNGFVADDITVAIGGVDCVVMTTDFASVVCVTGPHGAALVSLQVTSNNVAYDATDFEYSNSATPIVTSVMPIEEAGGNTITLSGSGFGTTMNDVTVTVGGVSCSVTSVIDATIQCTLGAREGGAAEIELHVAGRGVASAPVNFTYLLSASSASPLAGSYGGGQSMTVDGFGFSSGTTITICGNTCDVQSQTSTQMTCLTPGNENLVAGTTTCSIVIANGGDSVTLTASYVYQSSDTAIITSVSPDRGGTAGGTVITISGSGFSSIGSPLTVSIDGSECAVSASNDISITCETNEHQGSIRTKVQVNVGSSGIATQDNADYYYIDRWSSIFTWGGTSLPVDQDFVIIQQGQTVLLDTDTAVMTMLLIDGGELIFDEQDVTLNAENILITNGGLLQVGTEDQHFQHKANIVMYGQLRSPELPIYGAKTLAVRNGTLDLHGRHINHPWTKLASTAAAGSDQIVLEKSVNWLVDDYIVIASTGLRHSQSENEKRQITAISPDGLTLTLHPVLTYEHLGITENIDGVLVEFRAEVGLLTRNIVFRGSNDPIWNDVIPKCEDGFDTGMFATQTCFQGRFGEEIGSDQFGASIMMHSQFPNSPDIMARIENIEATYVGQSFRLGRYPIHWHLMGDVSGMYVRRCAIHRTFNRAVTIHGTHNLTVESNVVYDVMGGAIFIEDGIETGNVIQYNLAVFVRQSTSLLNDDITPAAYWVTNPDNILRHNHAAGGTHFGFWYRMHEHPDGPSFTADVCQQHVELGSFENNTVHSQGWFGLWIFQTYFPMEGGSCDSTIPSPAKFKSLTTWNCEKGAEWVNCGAIQFIDFVMVNNEVTGIDMKLITGTPWGEEGGAMVKNAIIIGHSDQSDSTYETQIGITLPFAPGLLVYNTRLINFDRGGVAFGLTSIQGTCVDRCGGFYYWVEDLSFTAVTKKVLWRWLHEGVIVDRDGSLTGGSPFTLVVPHSDLMDPTVCPTSLSEEFSSNANVPSAICEPSVRFHRVALNNVVPTSLEANDLIFTNQHGNSSSTYLKKRLTHKPGWMLLLPSKKVHKMHFKDGEQFTNITYNSKYYDLLEDDYVIVYHVLKQRPDVITINGESRFDVGNTTALTSSSDNLDWHYDQDTLTFSYILSGKTTSRKRRAFEIADPRYRHVSVSPNIYRCFYADCFGPVDLSEIPPTREKPDDFRLWSEIDNPCMEWVNDNTVVIKKSAVTSDGTAIDLCWVVVDVSSIIVDNITVEGVLHFEDTDVTVSAIYIMNQGGRIIAGFSSQEYFSNQLTIELRGDHNTPGWALPGIELGAKALGCFGGCDFHGKTHNVYWTHLAQTANAGSTDIMLIKEVDWEVGDEIVITTTSYKSSETEKHVIQSVASDLRTITLTSPLLYKHIGESYTANNWQYDMKAEVGLLTRNIKIKGQTYDNIVPEAFGARMLVGYIQTPDGEDAYGWARISNVEFYQTGQEGWTEPWDPRFSLSWVNTGVTTNARPSYVSACAFHDGFSTAIGTFGADEVNITDNIVHRTIHDGIRITGSGHRLERNLVTVTLFRGTYHDRNELTNFKDWQASFELSEANQLILNGNTAAGSERLCFHFDGEGCDAGDENAWTGNVAHGCLHGLQIFLEDGVGTCSLIRNFVVYKAWDYGIYHQTTVSVVIRNTIIVDSTIAYLPLIFQPAALTHEYVDKSATMEGVLCVGRSPHFDPLTDFMDESSDKNLIVRAQSPSKKAPLTPTGGKTCVMLPLFQSGANGAPFKPFHLNKNYPAIHGLLDITGLTAYNYKLNGDGTRDLVFYTNPSNEDCFHPTYLRETTMIQVEEGSKVFIARPDLGKVNPSDCVDMECDAKKKVLIKDFDGGLLGGAGAVVPQAEFGWDDPNHISRGLGDYRIPTAMLTGTDGTRFPVADIADNKGIIRNSACTYKSSWQAYDCHGDGVLDYRMLVIESLDEDTETRRLSPVALLGDRYIDLNNGPQDHGWCFGYTCQERISTFYTIIATNTSFNIFFTGYAPRNLRLHLLNVDSSKTVRVAIWYPRPERLDVIRTESGLYIHPQNSYYDPDAEIWALEAATPENQDQFKPPIDSLINGANYMDRASRLMYVSLRGSEPVDVITVPALIIAFNFPATSVDDFFGENLVSNLAKYLNVPSYKIRVVEVVRETSKRKRRQASGETVTYTVMVSDEIQNETSANSSSATTADELNAVEAQVVQEFQTGNLWKQLNISEGNSIATAPPSTNATTEEDYTTSMKTVQVPSTVSVTSFAGQAEEYIMFADQPTITLLDSSGANLTNLGGEWFVEVSLDTSGANADGNAMLLGNTNISFVNGIANFTDLRITHSGTYTITFAVSPGQLTSFSTSVTVSQRNVNVDFISGGGYIHHNELVNMTLELRNINGALLENIGYKGHTWKADVSLDNIALYGSASLQTSTATTFTFSSSTGRVVTTGLKLTNTVSYNKYTLLMRVYTEPALYDMQVEAPALQYISANDNLHTMVTSIKKIKVEFVGQPYIARTSSVSQTTYATYIYNAIVTSLNNMVYVANFVITRLTNGNTEVAFDLTTNNATVADSAVEVLLDFLSNPANGLAFNGQTLTIANSQCVLQVDNACITDSSVVVTTPEDGAGGFPTWVYVVVGVAVATLLSIGIITLSCVMKRAKNNKVGGGGCLDANSSRQSTPQIDSFSTTPTAFATHSSEGQAGNFSYNFLPRSGMTPIQT